MPPSDARSVQVPVALLHLRPLRHRAWNPTGRTEMVQVPALALYHPCHPPMNRGPQRPGHGPAPQGAPGSGAQTWRLPRTPAHTEATPATVGDPAPCPGTNRNLPGAQTSTPQVEPAFTWMTDIPDRLRRRLHCQDGLTGCVGRTGCTGRTGCKGTCLPTIAARLWRGTANTACFAALKGDWWDHCGGFLTGYWVETLFDACNRRSHPVKRGFSQPL